MAECSHFDDDDLDEVRHVIGMTHKFDSEPRNIPVGDNFISNRTPVLIRNNIETLPTDSDEHFRRSSQVSKSLLDSEMQFCVSKLRGNTCSARLSSNDFVMSRPSDDALDLMINQNIDTRSSKTCIKETVDDFRKDRPRVGVTPGNKANNDTSAMEAGIYTNKQFTHSSDSKVYKTEAPSAFRYGRTSVSVTNKMQDYSAGKFGVYESKPLSNSSDVKKQIMATSDGPLEAELSEIVIESSTKRKADMFREGCIGNVARPLATRSNEYTGAMEPKEDISHLMDSSLYATSNKRGGKNQDSKLCMPQKVADPIHQDIEQKSLDPFDSLFEKNLKEFYLLSLSHESEICEENKKWKQATKAYKHSTMPKFREKPKLSEKPKVQNPDAITCEEIKKRKEARRCEQLPMSWIPEKPQLSKKPKVHNPDSTTCEENKKQKPETRSEQLPMSQIREKPKLSEKPKVHNPDSTTCEENKKQKPETRSEQLPMSRIREKPKLSEKPKVHNPDSTTCEENKKQKPETRSEQLPMSRIREKPKLSEKPKVHNPDSTTCEENKKQKPATRCEQLPMSRIREKPKLSEKPKVHNPDSTTCEENKKQKPETRSEHLPMSRIREKPKLSEKPKVHNPDSTTCEENKKQKPETRSEQLPMSRIREKPKLSEKPKVNNTDSTTCEENKKQKPATRSEQLPMSQICEENKRQKGTDDKDKKYTEKKTTGADEKKTILYFKLGSKIKKDFNMTGYISTLLPRNVKFRVLKHSKDKTGGSIVFVKFDDIQTGDIAMASINSKGLDVCVFKNLTEAMSFSFLSQNERDQMIAGDTNKITDRAVKLLQEHSVKMEQIASELQRINKNIKKKFQSVDEYQKIDSERNALLDKNEEFERQKNEYINYLRSLHAKLEELSKSLRIEKQLVEIRKAFGVECVRFSNALPMYARRSDILTIIKENQVSIILGETGSGKSTQMPQYIHQAGFAKDGLIVCTQPRKVAAVSLATHVAAEMASSVGQLVGYQVGMKVKKTHATEIVYVTDHVLLNECLKDELLSKYACIIVDEAHERSIFTDLLLGMIKKTLSKRPELRVVITSATIDPDVFVRYFGNCPVLKVSGRMFPVEEVWSNPETNINLFEKYETLAVEKAIQVHKTEPAGDILVFLTSPIETERCCKNFGNLLQAIPNYICLQLHGKLQADEQQKVFDPAPKGKRKIVFATNSAETSITIPGIKYVIDTGLAKEMQFDPKRGMNSLNVTMITRSSAEQRKGRAGRTQSGKCYRLYTKDEFNEMRPTNVPEILRIHLGHAILKLMELGVVPLEFDFVESPSVESLEAANESLIELKAIDDNKITDLGRWIAKLPVDPKFGVLIYEGLQHGVCIEAMVIAVCAASSSIFYRSGTDQEKEKADRLKVRFCQPAGDLLTMLSVFREWHQQPERAKGAWCFENSINGKAISGVRENVNEIRKILQNEMKESVKFDFGDLPKVEEILMELIFKVLKPNICHYLGHQKAGYLVVKKDQFVQMHPSSALLPLGGNPEWMVFQQILKTSREFALVITPVSEELVSKAVNEGWLNMNVKKTKEKKVKEVFREFVGSQHFREFVGQRFTNLRKLEEELKTFCVNSVVIIDADRDLGTVKVFTSPNYKNLIEEKMKTSLYPIRDAFLSEEVEEPIINDNNKVRALIGAGGCVKHIYMPDEFQTVKIHCCVKDTADLTEYGVTKFFEQYGAIKHCRKYKYNAKFPSLWGQVTFQSTESAIKAVNETVGNPDISAKAVGTFTSSRDAFRTKITWCRRESRGFGFVELKNIEDLPVVTRCGSIMVGGSSARVTCAKNSPNQVYVGKFNQYVTEDVLRQSVADAAGLHPENDIAKINIVRSRVVTTPEMLDTYKRRLCAKIEEYAPRGQYTLELRTPTEASVMYTAFVSFKNPEQGNEACKEIDYKFMLQGVVVQMKADLKSSIFIHKRIHEKSKTEIEECIAYLEDSSPAVKLRTKELKSGNVIIDLYTDCVEDLARVKGILHEIVKGDTIDAVLKPSVKNLFTRNGRQKLETIMKNTDTIIINDYRVMTVSVHGTRTNRQKALNDIQTYLEEISHGVLKQIELKGPGKPPGIMKKLMETYGSDLTKLVTEAKLASVEIEQRFHRLKIVGTDSAVQKGLGIINDTINKLSGEEVVSDVEQPDCSICFCPIDNDELYRLESCGHEYCKDCIKRQAEISVTGRDFPLKCSQQDCEVLWAWRDLSNAISQGCILKTNLISSAVACFVTQNKDLYHYCISPDCPMVYKVTKDGQVFHCPVCEIRACTSCHIQSHDGMTCAMYKCMKEDDGSLKVWLQQKPSMRKLCPNCTTPIEKIAGCNKMTCIACKKCICWVCLAFFDDEQGCYAHLQNLHGGFQ